MALINIYVTFLCIELRMQTTFFFFALYIGKQQPDGEENILEVYNSLSFIISSVLGTSRRCFRIVPRIVVFSA